MAPLALRKQARSPLRLTKSPSSSALDDIATETRLQKVETALVASDWGSGLAQGRNGGACGSRLTRDVSPAVVSAGLRGFLLSRFDSLEAAFERLDFHANGRVSCLEFQEVISGQLLYCGLQEAREIFMLLAKKCQGAMTLENFLVALGEPEITMASPVHMEPSGHSMEAALRTAFPACSPSKRALEDADEATTMTPGSTRSALPGITSCPRVPLAASPTGLQVEADRGASSSSSDGLAARGLAPSRLSQTSAMSDPSNVFGFLRGEACYPNPMLRNGSASALTLLDEGLLAWRAEISAVSALRAATTATGQALEDRQMCAPMAAAQASLAASAAAQAAASASVLALSASPAHQRGHDQLPHIFSPSLPACGLSWTRQLPAFAQGRLAACMTPQEALDVLDETVDERVSIAEPNSGRSAASTPSRAGRWRNRATPPSPAPTLPGASFASVQSRRSSSQLGPEVAASAARLRQANSERQRLEELLAQEKRQHEAKMAELRRQLKRERRRKLQELLDQLSPPELALASAQGEPPPTFAPRSEGSPADREPAHAFQFAKPKLDLEVATHVTSQDKEPAHASDELAEQGIFDFGAMATW